METCVFYQLFPSRATTPRVFANPKTSMSGDHAAGTAARQMQLLPAARRPQSQNSPGAFSLFVAHDPNHTLGQRGTIAPSDAGVHIADLPYHVLRAGSLESMKAESQENKIPNSHILIILRIICACKVSER